MMHKQKRTWTDAAAQDDEDAITVHSKSLSLSFNLVIFRGGPGLADTRMPPFRILLELRIMYVVITPGAMTCKAPIKS